jgi:O-antigen ligase
MKIIIEILQQNYYAAAMAAFFIGVVTDFVWCRWMQNVANKKKFMAASYSVMVGVIALIYTSIIIANAWLPVACYLAGCFVGTYNAVEND